MARRQGLVAVIGLSVVTLAILAGIGSCSWSAWEDSQREAACEPHRSKVLKLEREATEVEVPLVSAWDPSILNLQLTRSLPPQLGDLTSAQATESDISSAYERRRELAGQAAKVVLEHRSCLPGFVEAAERIENSPTVVTWVEMPSAAHCSDGWPSGSIGKQGACSYHGGVVAGKPWATLHFD